MSYIDTLIQKAHGQKKSVVAIAAAHDKDVLLAAITAARQNITTPVLIGNRSKIMSILDTLNEPVNSYPIIDARSDEECANLAVSCVNSGQATMLMKGLLSTSALMKAVINKNTGLRTGQLLSHIMLYECPSYPRPLFSTDGGMNTFPSLDAKIQILENAANVLSKLGYKKINAACICGAEVVNPKITSMTDAVALSSMTEHWKDYNMNVFGPVGLDLAISQNACTHKNYHVPGAGQADILLVPSYEVGNGIGKAMTYFGNAKSAGIVVGAKVPIILVSRSDDSYTKLASLAFGSLIHA